MTSGYVTYSVRLVRQNIFRCWLMGNNETYIPQYSVMDSLAVAQLVERWTVELLLSIGHWFDSSRRDFLTRRHNMKKKLSRMLRYCHLWRDR